MGGLDVRAPAVLIDGGGGSTVRFGGGVAAANRLNQRRIRHPSRRSRAASFAATLERALGRSVSSTVNLDGLGIEARFQDPRGFARDAAGKHLLQTRGIVSCA